MEFDDEQFPNENSICNMQRSYASEIKAMSESKDNQIFEQINWESNSQILNDLAKKAPNNSIREYLLGLIELNQSDKNQLESLLKEKDLTKNPVLNTNQNRNFNQLLRLFIQNETTLLSILTQILVSSSKEVSSAVALIVIRRLEALKIISNFQTREFLFNLI